MWRGKRRPREDDSYQLRIGMYERRLGVIDRFGAGLGGLVLLLSAQLAGAPAGPLITAITLSLAVVTGGALGLARVGFDYEAIELKRTLEKRQMAASERLVKKDREWPDTQEVLYRAGVLLLVATAAAFLVGVWLAV
jgi:hypothetical protein